MTPSNLKKHLLPFKRRLVCITNINSPVQPLNDKLETTKFAKVGVHNHENILTVSVVRYLASFYFS